MADFKKLWQWAPQVGIALLILALTVTGFVIGLKQGARNSVAPAKQLYMCPMMCIPPRPEPGTCPVCGMELVPMPADMAAGDGTLPRLTMSDAAIKLAEVETATVARKFVELDVPLTGTVEYDETRVKKIAAWSPGRIERLFVDYTGVEVKKGDDLFTLFSTALVQPQSSLIVADKALRGLSNSPYSKADNQRAVKGARRKLRLLGLMDDQIDAIAKSGVATSTVTIRAPISGTVVEKFAQEGMYANEGTVLYTLADLSRVWVQLDAYETDLAFLRYGQKVLIKTGAYGGEKFEGWISFIDPTLDMETRTSSVRVIVDNPARRLKPGMFVRATVHATVGENGQVIATGEYADKWISPRHPEIVLDQPGDCPRCGIGLVKAEALGYASDREMIPPLVVPHTAVLYTGKRGVVYVRLPSDDGTENDGTIFEGVSVELGPRAGDYYVIRSGLREGQEVAVKGAFRIDSALQIMARPSMMHPAADTPATDTPTSEKPAPDSILTPPTPVEVTDAFRKQFVDVVRAYFEVQQAYGHDDMKAAKPALQKLLTVLDAVPAEDLNQQARASWKVDHANIAAAARAAVGLDDLAQMRTQFVPLSEALTAAVRRYAPLPGLSVRRAFCPMAFDNKGAYWLQESDELLNPYEGSNMPTCGSVKEVLSE